MSAVWYYLHDNVTLGPFTAAEIRERAARNIILIGDRIWQVAPADAIPDWLDDVALMETKGPVVPVVPGDQVPSWVEDLLLWHGMEVCAVPRTSKPQAKAAPDWLDGCETPGTQLQPPIQRKPDTMVAENFILEKAMVAIDVWAAEAANRTLLRNGTLEVIKQDALVAAILRSCTTLGPVVADKLLRHLETVVEGRRQALRTNR